MTYHLPSRAKRRKKLVELTPTHRPLTKKQARNNQVIREYKNEVFQLQSLLDATRALLKQADLEKANAEHAMRMARPSKPQVDALHVVCQTSALVALSVGAKFASALQELARWYVEITQPGPAPATGTCETASPLPPEATVVPLPPEARRRQRRR